MWRPWRFLLILAIFSVRVDAFVASRSNRNFFQALWSVDQKEEEDVQPSVFDRRDQWGRESSGSSESKNILQKVFNLEEAFNFNRDNDKRDEDEEHDENETNLRDKLARLGEKMANLIDIDGSSSTQTIVENILDDEDDDKNQSTFRVTYLLQLINQYRDQIASVLDKYLDHVDFSAIRPTSVLYYLEYEDERKNPSWKRRMHRFCKDIAGHETEILFDWLCLAKLSYSDSPEGIEKGLEAFEGESYKLVYAQTTSKPGIPAHFLAINEEENEVIISVRGTKSVADAITDLSCDLVDYRDGKAHAYVLKSGCFLLDQHIEFLNRLREESPGESLRVSLVGHSLGAAAASILALELNDMEGFDVQAYGFGCPAIVSPETAESCSDFITTVIADSDMVARTSGATISNLLIDISNFDWTTRAKKDVHAYLDALRERKTLLSGAISDPLEATLQNFLDEKSEEIELQSNKTAVEVFPPGKIIHYYYDGHGISAQHTPNHFFDEIDVTRRMLEDHLTRGYGKILIEHARQQNDDFNAIFETGLEDMVL